jgi:tRNA (adenine37-N6)-methyltransferase
MFLGNQISQLDLWTAVVTSALIFIGYVLLHTIQPHNISEVKPNQKVGRTRSKSPSRTIPSQVKNEDIRDHFDYFPPVGVLRSCFRECRGTPRQGSFAPSTRGFIQFNKNIPADSLDGLTDFTHVWIVFVFHKNTNFHHSRRAHRSGGSHSFRSKIKPPKLNGKSVGVFATRTPHRPNAIGITLARVEAVEGRKVILSALDLLDGTPILDIKPYVTPYDSVKFAGIPEWCGALPPQATDAPLDDRIVFDELAVSIIDNAASNGELRFYDHGLDVRRAIAELLISDVRPAKSYRRAKAKRDALCHFRFDMLLIGFIRHPNENIVARVVEIEVEDEKMDKELRSGEKARYEERR